MKSLGEGAFGTLFPATGIPSNDNRIEIDFGEVNWIQPGTYLVDIQVERVQGNQSFEQSSRLIFK